MKKFGIFALCILLLIITVQAASFWSRERELAKRSKEVEEKLQKSQVEHEKLRADIEYYSNSENLEKELRARFNYREPGERMKIIVAPQPQTSTPQ